MDKHTRNNYECCAFELFVAAGYVYNCIWSLTQPALFKQLAQWLEGQLPETVSWISIVKCTMAVVLCLLTSQLFQSNVSIIDYHLTCKKATKPTGFPDTFANFWDIFSFSKAEDKLETLAVRSSEHSTIRVIAANPCLEINNYSATLGDFFQLSLQHPPHYLTT